MCGIPVVMALSAPEDHIVMHPKVWEVLEYEALERDNAVIKISPRPSDTLTNGSDPTT